jgi:hypothetical protein
MTMEEAEKVRNYFSFLEGEMRHVLLDVPGYVRNEELEGYLDITMQEYYDLLQDRMNRLVELEEYEKALAIQRFTRARLKEYIR